MDIETLSGFGFTRSDIGVRHALLTPESHEWISQPGWPGCDFAVLISPDLGAKFSMALVRAGGDLAAPPAEAGIARFIYCLGGGFATGGAGDLGPGGYAFLPPDHDGGLHLRKGGEYILFEWYFVARGAVPAPVAGSADGIAGAALRGDDRLIVRKLLPATDAFDAEFNIMSFEPGATLAYVETHFMEHGLYMLDGGGIYRLDASWYPVRAGDAIWMGPHAPQWFGALGRRPSRYLIYKNFNRSPMIRRG